MNDVVAIRQLEKEDLPAVAAVHVAAFPASTLTTLGVEAVRRYYEWLLTGPHDVTALGAFVDPELVGFCVGGTFRGAMAGFLDRNRTFLAGRLALRPWLLMDPLFRDRLRAAWRRLRRFKRSEQSVVAGNGTTTTRAPCFGILSIAVHPQRQGMGLGRRLMIDAEACARRRGFRLMDLTVDPRNAQGVRFYEGLQWRPVESASRWTGRMTKTFD